MTTENITPAAQPATISKQELWALFIGITIKRSLRISTGCLHEAEYIPVDRLHAYGEFNELEGLGQSVAEIVADDDDPMWALNTIIDDVEGYLADLRHIRDDFGQFASALETDDDVPEHEIRYHRPAIGAAEQRKAA